MRHTYTDAQIEFLKKISKGKTTYEITALFNKHFDTDLGRGAIKSCMGKHHITNDMDRNAARKMVVKSKYSDEQKKFIAENIKGRFLDELLRMLNAEFKTNYKINELRKYLDNSHLKSGIDCTFKKGLSYEPGVKYQFKKGNIPPLYLPVGSEVITINGYTNVKIGEPNVWKRKHRIIWEKYNGLIPKNHVVIFGDRDRNNFDINNLIIVSRSQLVTMIKNKLIQNNAELTRTGVIIADLYAGINKRKVKTR